MNHNVPLSHDDGKLHGLRYCKVMFIRGGKARKETECWRCRRPIFKGDEVFRPMDNGMQRMRRLHANCAEELAEVAQ